MTDREQFESWLEPEYSRLRDEQGNYVDDAVYCMYAAWQAARRAEPAQAEPEQVWIPVSERLPPDETAVLILRHGEYRIGELRWEYPGYDETFKAFRYWDDPYDDGQCWEWPEITHWQPLPAAPQEQK